MPDLDPKDREFSQATTVVGLLDQGVEAFATEQLRFNLFDELFFGAFDNWQTVESTWDCCYTRSAGPQGLNSNTEIHIWCPNLLFRKQSQIELGVCDDHSSSLARPRNLL